MKKIVLLLLSTMMVMQSAVTAQFKKLEESISFDEPGSGEAKILKDKSGNTYFLHLSRKGELNVKAYNPDKTIKYDKNLKYKQTKEKASTIKGIFISNNDLTIFIESYYEKMPTLSRTLVSINNGEIISSEFIEKLDKIGSAEAFAMVYGYVPVPTYYIRKDPKSDAYAIVTFNTFASDRNDRIRVAHYDGNHDIISKSNYESPNEEYKYMLFKDIFVDGKNSVYVVAKGYNTKKSGGNLKSGLFIGKISKGENTFDMTKVDYANVNRVKSAFLRYNEVTNKFMLLTYQNKEPSKGKKDKNKFNIYRTFIATFDKNLENFSNTELKFSQLNSLKKKWTAKIEKVNVRPNFFNINSDGSYVIIMEETVIQEQQQVGGNVNDFSSKKTRNKYFLKDIGVIKYDTSGNILSIGYFPKSHQVMGIPSDQFYNFRNEMAATLFLGIQFKGYQYLDGPTKSYVLYNDIEANQKKMQAKKPVKNILSVGACSGYYFEVDGKGLLKSDKVIPRNKKEPPYLLLYDVSHYDKENNEYITLMVEKKKAKVVWLQPS